MKTTIKLSINDLRNVITEALDAILISERKGENKSYKNIVDTVLYKKGYLNEMALHKDEFIDLILNIKDQLVENWCLCAYCALYDKYNDNYAHWCCEFSAYANKIKRCNLKSGNKLKIITKEYADKWDLNDSDMIYRIIRGKFNREQIDVEIVKNLSKIFAQQVQSLASFLASENYETEEYIMRTFNVE